MLPAIASMNRVVRVRGGGVQGIDAHGHAHEQMLA